ncbi:hypothetical protein [Salipiger mucosus]|uniref:Uncharacterized protein n=1 Tax=Salipiger mucosus DSM 16094 TaxID=1123237 RepID=S9RJ24_9RHOB|nr:hypothetical protein [Salipiger mucosus]EPX78090.1 hypothetical protein Salmuc_03418 [Salipiger mucosus DSM 16094]
MQKRIPDFDRVTHFTITPIFEQQMGCSYNDAADWMVMGIAADDTVEFAMTTNQRDSLDGVLSECFGACPQAQDKVAFKSFENGEELYIAPVHPDELVAVLMEYVVDDMPDDAPNTDDHPLEEVQTALDEAMATIEVSP